MILSRISYNCNAHANLNVLFIQEKCTLESCKYGMSSLLLALLFIRAENMLGLTEACI